MFWARTQASANNNYHYDDVQCLADIMHYEDWFKDKEGTYELYEAMYSWRIHVYAHYIHVNINILVCWVYVHVWMYTQGICMRLTHWSLHALTNEFICSCPSPWPTRFASKFHFVFSCVPTYNWEYTLFWHVLIPIHNGSRPITITFPKDFFGIPPSKAVLWSSTSSSCTPHITWPHLI